MRLNTQAMYLETCGNHLSTVKLVLCFIEICFTEIVLPCSILGGRELMALFSTKERTNYVTTHVCT